MKEEWKEARENRVAFRSIGMIFLSIAIFAYFFGINSNINAQAPASICPDDAPVPVYMGQWGVIRVSSASASSSQTSSGKVEVEFFPAPGETPTPVATPTPTLTPTPPTPAPTLTSKTLSPSSLSASSQFSNVTITTFDQIGNPMPGVTVELTPSGEGAVISGSSTRTTGANGQVTFSVRFRLPSELPQGIEIPTPSIEVRCTANGVPLIDTIVMQVPLNTVIDTVTVGDDPRGIGVNSVTNRIFVANNIDGTVSVIDGFDNQVIGTVTVGNGPIGIGANPTTNHIFVANSEDNTVSVIDGSNNQVIDTVTVGNKPEGIGVNPITNRIFVANNVDGTVSVIDGETNQVIDLPIPVGNGPIGIRVNPETNRIFVANNIDGTVSVIDGETNQVIDLPIPVGNGPIGIGINPETNRIFVANSVDNTIRAIDGSTNQVIDTVTVGDEPRGIGVDATTNLIYVPNFNDDTVSVIDGSTNQVIDTVAVGDEPRGVGVNPTTNLIYVANLGSEGVISILGLAIKIEEPVTIDCSDIIERSCSLQVEGTTLVDITPSLGIFIVVCQSPRCFIQSPEADIEPLNKKWSVKDAQLNSQDFSLNDGDKLRIIAIIADKGCISDLIPGFPFSFISPIEEISVNCERINISNPVKAKSIPVDLNIPPTRELTPTPSPTPSPGPILTSKTLNPSSLDASLQFRNVTVSTFDQNGNPMPGVTVKLTPSGPGAVIMGQSTRTTTAAGQVTFSVRFRFLSSRNVSIGVECTANGVPLTDTIPKN